MRLKLQPATAEDAEAIAALRNAVSDDLTFKHGKGVWTSHCTTAGVLFDLRNAQLYVALYRDEAVASLVLAAKKPWAIDLKCFSKVKRPLYLTSMVVAPELQRQGLGRACFAEAVKIARRAKTEALSSTPGTIRPPARGRSTPNAAAGKRAAPPTAPSR